MSKEQQSSVSSPHSTDKKEKLNMVSGPLGEELQRIKADRILLAWHVAALVVMLFPLLTFTISRTGILGRAGEAQQQEYDEYGRPYKMHWWQLWRRSNPNQQNGGDDAGGAPWWYVWRDDRGEEEQGTGTIVFVYVWMLVSLVALVIIGNRLLTVGEFAIFKWVLLAFANICFLVMVLVGGLDAIEVEGQQVEENGWYGQPSVLLFLTCLFGLIKALTFAVWMRKKAKAVRAEERRVELVGKADAEATLGKSWWNHLMGEEV